MSFPFLTLLFLICLICFIKKKRRIGSVAFFLTTGFIFLVGGGFLPSLLLYRLQEHPHLDQPEWKLRNLIITLGNRTERWRENSHVSSGLFAHPRVHEAARLYWSCKKEKRVCHILVSGGDPSKSGVSEAEIMAQELIETGVSKTDLLLESKSNNTFQNAQFSDPIIREKQFDQIILVTSGTHLSRALLYFAHFKIYPKGAPSDQINAIPSRLPSSYNFLMMDLALTEYIGVLRFNIYNRLGLNKISLKPNIPKDPRGIFDFWP